MISHIVAHIKVNVDGVARYYVLLCATFVGIDVNLFLCQDLEIIIQLRNLIVWKSE